MEKVAPSARLREELGAFLREAGESGGGGEALSQLVRLATTLIVQEGMEAEQRDFIGRDRYERGERQGWRSGYKPGRLDTAEGRLDVAVPQVRGRSNRTAPGSSTSCGATRKWWSGWRWRCMPRGLSTRDVEAAFTDERGVCLLSRSAVSEVTEVLWEEYEAFQQRDLSDVGVLYLFLDGLYEPLRRHGIQREAVLVAWAITVEGHKVLVSLALGGRESHESWRTFLRDLVNRGLPVPLTITTAGAPGLIRADDEMWPQSLRLRCWLHRMRNVLAKVPEQMRSEVKAHLVAIRDAPTLEAGEEATRSFLERFGRELPSATSCVGEDLEALLNHLRLPWRHRKFVRTTNLVERSFVEERRRTKTLPRFFTERSCLKLVHATLIRAAARWQRVRITPLEYQQLALLFDHREIAPARKLEAVA